MIEVVFFDVDNTLYSHKLSKIPDSAVYAINKLKENNIKVVLATGRHKLELKLMDFRGIKFDAYLTLNGQLILDRDFNLLFSEKINLEDLKILEKIYNEKLIPMSFVEENDIYMNYHTKEVEEAQKLIGLSLPTEKHYSGNDIYQVTFFSDNESIEKVCKKLSNCKYTGWNKFGSDLINIGGGKAKAVEKIIKYFNIEKTETMAFGDGENDIDMIEYVEIGVAVGESNERLKNVADYITSSIENDGIKSALEKYKII